jgi:type II secretory pathway component PulF
MPAFEYQALDANGHTQTGVLQADTPRAARGSLRERGLNPLSVSAVREGGSRTSSGFGRGLGSAQLALFARQLATLVGSGLPIDESLAALAEGSEGRMRSLVVALRARVMEGNALAAALAEHPQAFPALFRTSIADSVRDYGLWMALAAVLLSLTAVFALRQPAMRERLQLGLLRLPLLGKLLRAVDTSRFARTLALLTASAVPLLEAIGIAAQVVQILPLRRALAQVALRVREGRGFARALAESRQFPPIAVRLIQSGETSGRLEAMLSEAADHQERELDAALGMTMAALGPAVILLIGGMVLFIVLAILLPIFDLNSLIK